MKNKELEMKELTFSELNLVSGGNEIGEEIVVTAPRQYSLKRLGYDIGAGEAARVRTASSS